MLLLLWAALFVVVLFLICWGARGLDDIILQRRDDNLDDTFGANEQYFHIKDSLGSTRATIWMLQNMAIERVKYNPFGEARHSWLGDIDGDHDVDATDLASYPGTGVSYAIGHASYRVGGDVDRNGIWDVNATAYAHFFSYSAYDMNAAEPSGSVSGFSSNTNEIGYAGYVFISPSLLYHVRNRDYQPEDGWWLQRDPTPLSTSRSPRASMSTVSLSPLYETGGGSPRGRSPTVQGPAGQGRRDG